MRNYAHIKDMNTVMIAVTAVLVIALIALVIIICIVMSGRKQRRNQYQSQSKSVLVKNGVDVKKQVLGGGKGEYFTGNLEKQGTCYVNGNVKLWRIIFDNLNTREQRYMDFSKQMWVGRTTTDQKETAKLILYEDEKVSRNHCLIYECNGTLCLQDLKSRNHTYLNGKAITNAVYLQNGDVLQVGDTQFKVHYSIQKK